MKSFDLIPKPANVELFRRSLVRHIPAEPGCYVLCNINNLILYIGLAKNLRKRIEQHLDNPAKRSATEFGRAVYVSWICSILTENIERSWMNMYKIEHGKLPIHNKIFSPVKTDL